MFLMKIKTSCSMLEFISTSSFVDSLFNVQEANAKWTWKVYGSLVCSSLFARWRLGCMRTEQDQDQDE